MRETNIASIEAYRKEIEPHLSEKQLQVLQVFNLYKTEKCCHDIALHLRKSINEVSGRITESSAGKLIENKGRKLTRHSKISLNHYVITDKWIELNVGTIDLSNVKITQDGQ